MSRLTERIALPLPYITRSDTKVKKSTEIYHCLLFISICMQSESSFFDFGELTVRIPINDSSLILVGIGTKIKMLQYKRKPYVYKDLVFNCVKEAHFTNFYSIFKL